MATHELYVGGPASSNYSRAMFPAPPFNAAGAAFLAVRPSAHKGPATYNMERVIDTTQHAMAEFLRNTAVVQGDVLGVSLLPRRTILEGFFYEVETAVGAATVLTPSIRGFAGTIPTINANVVGSGYVKFGGAAWLQANALINAGAGAGLEGEDVYLHTPAMLDLTLTTLTEPTKLGRLRMSIVPLLRTLDDGGQY